MDGAHDLGGAHCFGRVEIESDEPVWHAEWERALLPMMLFAGADGWFTNGSPRYGIELMHPADYLTSTYYEHWLHALEYCGVQAGRLDMQVLDRRTQHYLEHPEEPLPADRSPDLVDFVNAAVVASGSGRRDAAAPRYAVGDAVRVRHDSPPGHTRRPRYVRGRIGEVVASHGAFVYPDSAAHGSGEDPQHVYTIRFRGEDLWGEGNGDPNVTVCIEVYEPYVEPATAEARPR